MTDPNQPMDKDKAMFTSLAMMLASTAMQQMGKLVNPMTQKTEVDLEGARTTIDLLEVIKKKTDGNLEPDEDKMLTELLSSLQLNYVETSNASGSEPEQKPSQDATEPEAEKKEGKAGKDDQDPKFHKSYG